MGITYVAFLRAINVGGHVVTMEKLRGLFREIGFKHCETFIASGNVIFENKAAPDRKLEQKIEAHLEKQLGYAVATFVRSAAEVEAIARYRSFEPALVAAAHAHYVGFLSAPLDEPTTEALLKLQTPIDSFHVHGRELHWLLQKPQTETKITNKFLERTIQGSVTFRNITSVAKLTKRLADHAS